jgi:hypothetical protein
MVRENDFNLQDELGSVGYKPEQAKALLKVMDKKMTDEFATKHDLQMTKKELQDEIKDLRYEMNLKFEEMNTKFMETNARMDLKFAELRAELIGEIKSNYTKTILAFGALMMTGIALVEFIVRWLK